MEYKILRGPFSIKMPQTLVVSGVNSLQHLVYEVISHHAQDAGHPPATWHDNSTG